MAGTCIGEKSENVECTERECEYDVITFSRTYEEGDGGIEEFREGMLVVEKGEEELHATLGAEECRCVARRNAPLYRIGRCHQLSARELLHAHKSALQGQECGAHATLQAPHTARSGSKPALFPREENAETIRLTYVHRSQNERVVLVRMGHTERKGPPLSRGKQPQPPP